MSFKIYYRKKSWYLVNDTVMERLETRLCMTVVDAEDQQGCYVRRLM